MCCLQILSFCSFIFSLFCNNLIIVVTIITLILSKGNKFENIILQCILNIFIVYLVSTEALCMFHNNLLESLPEHFPFVNIHGID